MNGTDKGKCFKNLSFFNEKINKDVFPPRPVDLSSGTNFVKEKTYSVFGNDFFLFQIMIGTDKGKSF